MLKNSKVFVAFVCLMFLSAFTVLALFCYRKLNYVLPWQYYPGKTPKVLVSLDDAKDCIASKSLGNITIEFIDSDATLNLEDFAEVEVNIKDKNLLDWLISDSLNYSLTYKFDEDVLKDKLRELYVKCSNASIEFSDDGTFHIVKETYGKDFAINAVTELIVSSVNDSKFSIDVRDLCKRPTVVTSDLQELYEEVNWVNDFNITYVDGTSVTAKDLKYCWDTDYTFDVEQFDVDSIVTKLESSFNTFGKGSIDFHTTSGKNINVRYGTFGKTVDKKAEKEYLLSLVGTHASVLNREPVMTGYDTLSSDYIEVSIADQHLWHYVSGSLCCESDVVTGRKGRHDTPTGVYYVSEKIPGKNLRGDNYVTWVNRWMRLTNSGIGLHDAYWRGKFGGNIYTYNGSHGCINLPKNYAYKLYDEITKGTTVVIYNE